MNQSSAQVAAKFLPDAESLDELQKLRVLYENTYLERFDHWPENFQEKLRAENPTELSPEGQAVAICLGFLTKSKGTV